MSGKTFIGGPFDGHPVSESDEDYLIHTFAFANQMAVYELDESNKFVFVGIAANDGGDGCNCVNDI